MKLVGATSVDILLDSTRSKKIFQDKISVERVESSKMATLLFTMQTYRKKQKQKIVLTIVLDMTPVNTIELHSK